jgi:regulator of sigma E protease
MIHVIAFLVVLGILIFIHEFGHFIVAKLAGVKVLKFSLGFGPKLIGRRMGETDYMISALPLGGYVRLLGDDPKEEVDEQDQDRAFLRQPVRKRAAIVAAGPVANLLFAALAFALLAFAGIPQLSPVVGDVVDGFPAQEAGIRAGDRILTIDGKRITQWSDLLAVIPESEGRNLEITVERGDAVVTVDVAPRVVTTKTIFGEETKTYQIGIVAGEEFFYKREPLHTALWQGVYQTWLVSKLVVVTVIKMIQQVIPAKTLGGPIMIAQMAGERAQEGLLSFIFFMAVLSVNLGILNLIPIPILDGGHLLFLGIESVTGKPLSTKKMEVAQQIGLLVIIFLMAFVFYNDIMRLIPHSPK